MYQMRVNLRRKEAQGASQNDATLIVPRELTRKETIEVFEFQSRLQQEAI